MFTGRGNGGHTLVELMIASAVLLVLLLAIYQLFVATKRYQENCAAKLSLQDSVLKSLAKMSAELVESDRYAVQVDPAEAISFASPRGFDGKVSFDVSGRMLWKKYVVYFVQQNANGLWTLYRKSKPYSPFRKDVPAPPAPLVVRDDDAISAKVVARHIRHFTPTANPDGTYTLHLRGELQVYHHKYGVDVVGRVFPNN